MKQQEVNTGFGTASLVCGILSCIVPYVSTILGILAIVFYSKNKESGLAKAGLVTGIIGLVFSLIIWSVILLVGTAAFAAM
jgi:hypothetical protein